jgi:hypothetical protein
MSQRALFVLVAAAFLSLLACSDCWAQGGYRPARPTFSPYLNYFRGDVGALDPYNANVAPAMRLRREMDRQNQSIQYLGGELARAQARASSAQDKEMAPTGTGAVYMNLSHFYRMPAPRRR